MSGAGGGTSGAGTRSGRGDSSSNESTVDRDALLKALFPSGIPARQDVLLDVNDWLEHAERLARSR